MTENYYIRPFPAGDVGNVTIKKIIFVFLVSQFLSEAPQVTELNATLDTFPDYSVFGCIAFTVRPGAKD